MAAQVEVSDVSDTGIERRYSSGEIAKVYGVSPRTVVQWIYSGRLEAVKIGKQWFCTAGAVKEMEQKALSS